MSKILIVDDDEQALHLFEAFLGRSTAAVDTAASAEVALMFLSNNKYDLIILDIKLIGMNGVELALKIREEDKDVKIVGITGYYSPIFTQYDYRLAGFDAVFEKPIGYKDFITYLEKDGFI